MAAFAPTSTSTPSPSMFIQELVLFQSRKLLTKNPNLYPIQDSATPPTGTSQAGDSNNNSFDSNVVMVLSVLLCALICSLGLNSIIKCALRCSNIVSSSSSSSTSITATSRLANTGIKKKALKTFPTITYAPNDDMIKLPGMDTECVICLSEFTAGDKVRILPKCNHGFHVKCIDKWLNSHSSCPTCRHCLIETCQKIVGCNTTTTSGDTTITITTSPVTPPPPPPPQTASVRIVPLEPEGLARSYEN